MQQIDQMESYKKMLIQIGIVSLFLVNITFLISCSVDPKYVSINNEKLDTVVGLTYETKADSDYSIYQSSVTHQMKSFDFNFYDEIHTPYYIMVNREGKIRRTVSIRSEKRFDWLAPIKSYSGSGRGQWYSHHTEYEFQDSKCGHKNQIQVAHRWISPEGTVWEIGGQPGTHCDDHTLNVYSDRDNNWEPILIAPSSKDEARSFISAFWTTKNPYQRRPQGYPVHNPIEVKYAFSWAKVVNHHADFTVKVGNDIKSYNDVLEVFWLHGSRYSTKHRKDYGSYPCQVVQTNSKLRLYKKLIDSGYQSYGRRIWYARHSPDQGQFGGIIKDQTEFYCQFTGENYRPIGNIIGHDTTQFRKFVTN